MAIWLLHVNTKHQISAGAAGFGTSIVGIRLDVLWLVLEEQTVLQHELRGSALAVRYAAAVLRTR